MLHVQAGLLQQWELVLCLAYMRAGWEVAGQDDLR